MAILVALAAPAAHAAQDCQPVFDAYAALLKVPVMKRTVTTPGMADPVEMILTPEAFYSRTGAKDKWEKMPLNAATRAVMQKAAPTPETVRECRLIGPGEVDGVSGTAYEFTPPKMGAIPPGEKITVLLDDRTGLPLVETALKAGTKVTSVYDGVSVPVP